MPLKTVAYGGCFSFILAGFEPPNESTGVFHAFDVDEYSGLDGFRLFFSVGGSSARAAEAMGNVRRLFAASIE